MNHTSNKYKNDNNERKCGSKLTVFGCISFVGNFHIVVKVESHKKFW